MKITETMEKEIDSFVDKIQPVYELLKWKWYNEGVPTKEMIKKNVIEHITKIVDENCTKVSSGGLYAEKLEDSSYHVKLGFEVEEFIRLS